MGQQPGHCGSHEVPRSATKCHEVTKTFRNDHLVPVNVCVCVCVCVRHGFMTLWITEQILKIALEMQKQFRLLRKVKKVRT